MSEHAFISPSNVRAEQCPASALREDLVARRAAFIEEYSMYYYSDAAEDLKDIISDDNAMADTGNALHAMMESMLYGESFESANTGLVDEEFLLEALQETVVRIFEHADGATINPEQYAVNVGVNSGGTMDATYRLNTTLVVRDLKTGYIPVSAVRNSQLMRYASALMDTLEWDEAILSIELHIDALRFTSTMWRITPAELLEWRDGTFAAFMLAGNGLNPVAIPGDHCGNCKAKANCGEVHEWAHDVALAFDRDFGTMELSTLEQLYLDIPVVDKLKTALKDEIMLRTKAGFSALSLLKEKQGASNTSWAIKPDGVIAQLGDLSVADIAMTNGKLKTPAKLAGIFHAHPDALKLIATDGVDLETALAPYIGADLLLTAPKLVTPAKLKGIVAADKLTGIIKEGRNKPSLIKGDKK